MNGLCECGCGQPAPIATQTNKKWGHVKGQPTRYVLGHGARRKTFSHQEYEERDCGYETPCWVWLRAIDENGYGRAWCAIEKRQARAHAVMWRRYRGPIPEGLDLDHLCRNRRCVNPDHLEPVTRAENLRRGREAWEREERQARDLLTLLLLAKCFETKGRLYVGRL